MNSCPCPFATTTPSDYDINSAFGYTTNARNFPGLLSLTFQPSSTIAGYAITQQASLLSLIFANLISLPASAVCTLSSNPGVTSISFPALTGSAVTIGANANVALTSFSMPVVTTLSGTLNVSGCVALPSLVLPLLTTAAAITLTGDIALTTLTLASLVTSGAFNASGCTTLQHVSIPNFLPSSGNAINFGAAALTQTSVDHVLARAVANAAYVTGTITLNGGTSAAPGTQGQLDKATLIARGCTVLTN